MTEGFLSSLRFQKSSKEIKNIAAAIPEAAIKETFKLQIEAIVPANIGPIACPVCFASSLNPVISPSTSSGIAASNFE